MGAGGVGGYLGALLARAGATVALVARGAHLQAIRERGLTVRSVRGDFTVRVPASAVPAEVPALIGPIDLVLFCVKGYDTEAAAGALGPLLGPGTAVLTLQNGVASREILAARLGPERVLGGAVYGFLALEGPGVVRHTQGGRLVVGEPDGRETPRVRALAALAEAAGLQVEVSRDVRRVLWEKYLFICPLSALTALTQRPVGEIRACPEARQLFRTMVEELAALGRAEGVALGPDAVERTLALMDGLRPDAYSSLYHDLVGGRRLEVETLQGHAVRLGARHGVPTPALFAVYATLRPMALARERES